MATATGLTAARIIQITDAGVTGATINTSGRLILSTRSGRTIDVGLIKNPNDVTNDILVSGIATATTKANTAQLTADAAGTLANSAKTRSDTAINMANDATVLTATFGNRMKKLENLGWNITQVDLLQRIQTATTVANNSDLTAKSSLVNASSAVALSENAIERVESLEVIGGLTPGNLTDATMTNIASNPASTFNTSINSRVATVGLGRSITDFGASPLKSGVDNWNAIRNAVIWAETNTSGARTLFIPALNAGEYFDITDTVEIPDGIVIVGSGRASRLRAITKPKPIFRTKENAKNTIFRDFSVHGLANRFLQEGGWSRENHTSLQYSGITFQAGSDGGIAENIYGENLACVVNFWAYSEALNAFAGMNIQGLTIKGIRATNVWGAVFGREADNLIIDDISGSYSRPGGTTTGALAAPAHLVYITSSSALAVGENPRKMHNVNISNVRAKNGSYGAAFAFKHIVNGTISNVVAEDCEGLWDLNQLNGVTITNARSMGDRRPPSITVASLHLLGCLNTTIDNVVVDFAEADHGRTLYLDSECANVVVRNLDYTTRHTVAQSGSDNADIGLYGVGNRVERPKLTALGQPRNGIAFGGTDNVVVKPTLNGINRGIQFLASAVRARIDEYDEALITFKAGITTTFAKMDVVAGASLMGVRPKPDNALVFDRQDFGLGGARSWIRTTSGHVTTLKGTWILSTDNRVECNLTGDYPRFATVNAGSANVEIESDVWIGAKNTGGSASLTQWAGLGIRMTDVATSSGLLVELRPNAVTVCTYTDAGGATRVDLATAARTHVVGRRYRLRVLVSDNLLQVFIGGALVLETILSASVMSTYGAATTHGYAQQLMLASRFANLTIRSL